MAHFTHIEIKLSSFQGCQPSDSTVRIVEQRRVQRSAGERLPRPRFQLSRRAGEVPRVDVHAGRGSAEEVAGASNATTQKADGEGDQRGDAAVAAFAEVGGEAAGAGAQGQGRVGADEARGRLDAGGERRGGARATDGELRASTRRPAEAARLGADDAERPEGKSKSEVPPPASQLTFHSRRSNRCSTRT